MFNVSSPYNRAPFNRPYSVLIYASTTLDGAGTLSARAIVEFQSAVDLHGIGELFADAVREIYVSAQRMDGIGTLDADAIRDRFAEAIMHGIGTLTADAGHYRVEIIEYTGDFAPSDIIVIDTRHMTVTKNGVNDLHNFNGDLITLNVGDNEIVWEDTESNRTVRFRITYQDVYV